MATVAFRCPACSATLSLAETALGKRIKCPRCGKAVTVSAPAPPPRRTVGDTRDFSDPHDESQSDPEDDEPEEHPSLDFLRPAQAKDEVGRLGNFRILRELGRGGMGVVLLAEDTRLDRQVALKVMLPRHAAKAKAKDRFLREAKTAASIENDHIITILQVDEDNGVPYLAMPVLKGESLSDRLKREKRLPIGEVVRIAWEICDGLSAAHDHKLVHRDLKPGNLWIESPKGRVKILDFGLARPVETNQHLTRTGVVVGTPAYMAPEQARSATVDFRADLFSLGVIVYQMLVGQLPFRGHDALSTMMAICTDLPEPPAKRVKDLPLDMNALVLRLLEKEAKDRFASAAEVGQALEAIHTKHFGGMSGPTSDRKLPTTSVPRAMPVEKTIIAAPAVPTQEAPNPFAFRAKRDKLVSLSSSSEVMPVQLPVPKSEPPKKAESKKPETKKAEPKRQQGRMWPWMAVGGGLMGLIVLVVAVVIQVRGVKDQPIAEVSPPKKGKVVAVEKKEAAIELPVEPVAELEDPFPQFDPTPLPPWDLPKGAPKPALAPFDAKQAKKHQEEWAAYLKTPAVMENSIGMKLALVPPGEFDLSPTGELQGFSAKAPKRRLSLTHGYYLGTTEVTHGQFQRFVEATAYKTTGETRGSGGFGVYMDWDKSYPQHDWKKPGPINVQPNHPVVDVTMQDARAFTHWLSKKDKAIYRLPTEAEWENGCRAGNVGPRGVCDPNEDIWNYAWGKPHAGDPLWATEPPYHQVGKKLANPFGLFDTLGNVWEYCADDLSRYRSTSEPISNVNPWGPPGMTLRGAAWDHGVDSMTPGYRHSVNGDPMSNAGFRVLRQLSPDDETPPFLMRPMTVKPNEPLSLSAFVRKPTAIRGLLSWTIQPILGTGGLLCCQPSGDLVAATSESEGDNSIRIWNNKAQLSRVLLGHREMVRSMQFSPDGTLLATGERTAVRIWKVSTGACLAVLGCDGEQVYFSADSKRVIAFSYHQPWGKTKSVPYALWDLDTGVLFRGNTVGDLVAWSPKSDRMLVASRHKDSLKICVADPMNPSANVDLEIPGENRDPNRMKFRDVTWSPDGKTLAAIDEAERIHFWDARTHAYRSWMQGIGTSLRWNDAGTQLFSWSGDTIWTIDPAEKRATSNISLSVDGKLDWAVLGKTVATASNGGLFFLDAADGSTLYRNRKLGRVQGNGKWGVVGGKKKSVAVCVDDGNIRTYDLDTGISESKRLWFHPGPLQQSPRGDLVLILGPEEIGVTDANLSKAPRRLPGPMIGGERAEWSPSGTLVAAAARDQNIYVWQAVDGVLLKKLDQNAQSIGLVWSPDGGRLASLDREKIIRVWDTRSWALLQTLDNFAMEKRSPRRIAWGADGKNLIVTNDRRIQSLSLDAGTVTDWGAFGYTPISGVVAGPGFKNYLLSGNDGNRWVFEGDIKSRKFAGVFGAGAQMLADGRLFVAGLNDKGWLQAYDMKTHTKLGTLIPKMTGNHWICIGPDGHYVGSEGVEEHIVYVAMTDDGRQETYTPAEFARRYGWKNDPSKARFAALPP